jgi:putative ABC transport system permease protein
MGASIMQIVTLTAGNYLWLALISAVIAFPVAYYFMNEWLKIFSYSNGLSVIPFIVSAIIIILTAVLTVMFYSAKAALAKPAENLRSE